MITFIIYMAPIVERKIVVRTHFILSTNIEDIRSIIILLEKTGNFFFRCGKTAFLQFILCQCGLSGNADIRISTLRQGLQDPMGFKIIISPIERAVAEKVIQAVVQIPIDTD